MFNKSVKMDNRKKNPLDADYTSGGILMPRRYQHIINCKKEILELKSQELTLKEIEYLFVLFYQCCNYAKYYNSRISKITSKQDWLFIDQ